MSGPLDRISRLGRTWAINTVNSAVYALSLGRTTWHEGRYSAARGRWDNWNRTFSCRPTKYVQPTTEEEIRAIVRDNPRVRVVGAGHTFNGAPLTDDVLLSMDRYNRVLEVDRAGRRARVQAGIRLRDLMPQLEQQGLDMRLLGSTNAQSMGGLVASDLHGTGRDNGFLSEQVLEVRVVNARGEAETYPRGHPHFRAVFGGLGCCGVVTELTLDCVEAYNLERSIRIVRRDWAEENIDQLLAEHQHLSFYYLGGIDAENVRINVWDRTDRPARRSNRWHDLSGELIDMLFGGYLVGLGPTVKAAKFSSRIAELFFKATMDNRKTVYASSTGFRRRLYYHHDELEYGIPRASFRPCLQELLDMLARRRHVCVVEVRFAPNKSEGLLGPGVGRETCFIELAPSLSRDPAEIFEEAETIFWRYRGQFHPGKVTRATPEKMREMFGDRFELFQEVRRRQDPDGKFENAFVRRLFGPVSAAPVAVGPPGRAGVHSDSTATPAQ